MEGTVRTQKPGPVWSGVWTALIIDWLTIQPAGQ